MVGGSSMIEVGTAGKISVLMGREMESARSESSKAPSSCRRKTSTASVSCGTCSQRDHRRRGEGSNGKNYGGHGGAARKTCNSRLSASRVPFLSSDEISSHGRTPDRRRELPGRNGCCVAEVVKLNCGTSTPMANRLKKLGFSKLSQTIN